MYRIGADLVLLAHFLFAAFAVFGGVLAFCGPVWPWLRARAGQTGHSGDFVQRYIGPVVYPGGMPRRLELVAGVSVLAWNVLVYAVVLWSGR